MGRTAMIIILTLFILVGCAQQPIGPTAPLEEITTEEQQKTGENCTIGWKCLDQNRKGYQFSDCVFTRVNICEQGCKDGECIPAPPKEEEKTFSLTEGIARMKETGWKLCDFSEEQILEDGVTKIDLKVKLYIFSSGITHFRVESSRAALWAIDKGIADATREDCMESITDANVYSYLRTWQTLCILTKENNTALIGGYWKGIPDESTRLNWKYYAPE